MKKMLVLLAAFAWTSASHAETYTSGGNINQPTALKDSKGRLVIQTIPANSGYVSISNNALTVVSYTVTTINLTHTAGYDGEIEVWLTARSGAMAWWFHPTAASAPALATIAESGSYISMSQTPLTQITGGWSSGTHISLVGLNNASCVGSISFMRK